MKTRLVLMVLAIAGLLVFAGVIAAQEPVVGSSDPESLFTSKDPKLNTNKQAAMHIMRDLLEAGHWDEAPKWLTERYIQHNPGFASGRQTVMNAFGARGNPRPIPDKNSWNTKVVSVVAEGDYVTVAVVRTMNDPREPGKTYTTTWFDMWRFVDGKADEHWDYGTINAPRGGAGGPGGAPGGAPAGGAGGAGAPRGGGQRQ
jgi:predicted SnoaL-like aldol condensation-catalyzing enzyme